MEYNRALEIAILRFLRVRVGKQFTPDELFEQVKTMCVCTRDQYDVILRTMNIEELILVSTVSGDSTLEIQSIDSITKGGLELLRSKKY